MKRIALLILVIGVAAATGAGWFLWERENSPAAKNIKVLRSTLFDPDSSQLQYVKYFPSTGATCGAVNSKNLMGGYVGFTMFVVTLQGEVLFDPKADTESGTAEMRLAAVDEQIAFLKRVQKECSEPEDTSTSSAK